MSLIIAIYVQEGIVLASDTRTTFRSKDGTRYKDDTQKIIPFTTILLWNIAEMQKTRTESL